MKGLVIYSLKRLKVRNTLVEHLFSFKKYSSCSLDYLNVKREIPFWVNKKCYDFIILHYSFLADERFVHNINPWKLKSKRVKEFDSIKIAIPQDEHQFSDRLFDLFSSAKIDIIYTLYNRDDDIKKVYLKSKTYNPIIKKVLTGYIDDNAIKFFKNSPNLNKRKIDFAYRARSLMENHGRHASYKVLILKKLKKYLDQKAFNNDIEYGDDDISSLLKSTKLGKDWFKFLISSKFILGSESGASLLDVDGSIQKKVFEFKFKNPKASFNEIEKNCFKNIDFNVSYFMMGPKNFEAILSKTLQILIEGEYNNILKPSKHYIELKKDFSNIDEIIKITNDLNFCQKFVDDAKEDILKNKRLYYKNFVEDILMDISNIKEKRKFDTKAKNSFLTKIILAVHNYSIRIIGEFKILVKLFLSKVGILKK